MNIRFAFLLSLVPVALSPSGPLINRYIPTFFMTPTQLLTVPSSRPQISVMASAGHASKSSPMFGQSQEMYRFDGLMEMGGWYDLHELVASATTADASFSSPFAQETGGNTLASRQLLFGAQSSISLYGLDITTVIPLKAGFKCGISVPLYHVEARQRYDFPVTAADQTISQPQIEQAHRMRQAAHKSLGMMQRDWIVDKIGDINGWVEYLKTWSRVWLLRTIQFGGRMSVSVPTGAKEDAAYPASFALGNRGSWGFGLTLLPRFEVKELIWLQVPFTVIAQTPVTREQRLPVYGESMQFGVLQGLVKTVPGVSIATEPSLMFQHFIDNLHVCFGFSFLKHYTDALTDMRGDQTVESYLTRTTLPAGSFGSGAGPIDTKRIIGSQKQMKRMYTGWSRMYLTFGLQYELADLFAKSKYAPTFNLGIHYCIGDTRSAKMHQVTTGLSWRF